jgi:hypothetical protein
MTTSPEPQCLVVIEIQDIYEAIISVNPNYTAEINDKDLPLALRNKIEADKLSARNTTAAASSYACGVFKTGNANDIADGQNHLASLGGTCGASGTSCARMTCKNTSGTYVSGLCLDIKSAEF